MDIFKQVTPHSNNTNEIKPNTRLNKSDIVKQQHNNNSWCKNLGPQPWLCWCVRQLQDALWPQRSWQNRVYHHHKVPELQSGCSFCHFAQVHCLGVTLLGRPLVGEWQRSPEFRKHNTIGYYVYCARCFHVIKCNEPTVWGNTATAFLNVALANQIEAVGCC